MTEIRAETPDLRKSAPSPASEAAMLVTIATLSGLTGAGLHLVAAVPAPMAILAAITMLSATLAAHAMARRSALLAARDTEIAELRAEVQRLRIGRQAQGARSMYPIPYPYERGGHAMPGIHPAASASAHPPLGPNAPLGPLQREALVRPGPESRAGLRTPDLSGLLVERGTVPGRALPVLPVYPIGEAPPEARPASVAPPDFESMLDPFAAPQVPATAQPAAQLSNGTLGPDEAAPEESGRPRSAPGSQTIDSRSPSATDPAIRATGGSSTGANTDDTPALAGSTPPSGMDHTLVFGQADESGQQGGSNTPTLDTAPRAMPSLDSGAWPRAEPKIPTTPLDLGTMQGLIEQLAVRLDLQRPAGEPPEAAEAPAVRHNTAPPVVPSIQDMAPAGLRAVHTEAGAGDGPAARDAPDPGGETAPFAHLALIAEAVEASRLDICLDPILGLADRRTRHFELSVRLLTANGASLGEGDYAAAAAGTGLLARIDAAKLSRAVEIIDRLRSRGSPASLFSPVAGESLADENFASAFADILAAEETQPTRLVLTFAQDEARNFTPAHWRTVSEMSAVGLQFALAEVTDLDMDFDALTAHGFTFVKLDASVFLEGLPTPAGRVPAADICRHLSGLGLGLIVGGIIAEKDLARILGFGAILGQGALFGGPRSVEVERARRAA
jgi:cyclic-di-GMP phosphodiesterase TipF (flagellum assembly factor)